MIKRYIYIVSFLAVLSSCTSEKEVVIPMPDYENEPVIECYLQPGRNYRLTLTRSVPYLSESNISEDPNAIVTINYQGSIDTLHYFPHFDTLSGNYYNYYSPKTVPFDFNSSFYLHIIDKNGKEITANTRLIQPVKIDSVEFIYNDRNLSYPQIYFKDNPTTANFYRYMVKRDSLHEAVVTDLITDDKLLESELVVLGGRPRFEPWDPVFIILYHLTREHYEFLMSTREARSANGNPFSQPSQIRSNIKGAIGIFTGLAYDMKVLPATTP
ncbi:MAG: DUF4249 domain-containing protein [Cytophagaceae bacterium]